MSKTDSWSLWLLVTTECPPCLDPCLLFGAVMIYSCSQRCFHSLPVTRVVCSVNVLLSCHRRSANFVTSPRWIIKNSPRKSMRHPAGHLTQCRIAYIQRYNHLYSPEIYTRQQKKLTLIILSDLFALPHSVFYTFFYRQAHWSQSFLVRSSNGSEFYSTKHKAITIHWFF